MMCACVAVAWCRVLLAVGLAVYVPSVGADTMLHVMQADLEDEILQLLSSATGSLLDNIQLINTLDASKTTWEQVNQSLQVCSLNCMQLSVTECLCHPLMMCIPHNSLLCCSFMNNNPSYSSSICLKRVRLSCHASLYTANPCHTYQIFENRCVQVIVNAACYSNALL